LLVERVDSVASTWPDLRTWVADRIKKARKSAPIPLPT
jgi:hypothetical protein